MDEMGLKLPKLVGLGGKLRSGKDTAGEFLEKEHGYVLMGMSDALNEALQKIGPEGPWVRLDFNVFPVKGWERGIYRGKYHAGEFVRYRELLNAVGYTEAKRHADVRKYLQGLGTEVGREMLGSDVWVEQAKKKIFKHWSEGRRVCITAMRFPNELEMVRELGGVTVWIERTDEGRGVPEGSGVHASENSVSAEEFDFIVDNSGTVEDLWEQVDRTVTRALI